MLTWLQKYSKWIVVAVVVAILVWLFFYWWKQRKINTIVIKDDTGKVVTFTQDQKNQANDIATRIHNDLNSGWFFGFNFLSGTEGGVKNGARDIDAYSTLAAMSDSLFAYTAQVYQVKYSSSIISDIRAESSLSSDTTDGIVTKANRLGIS